jgi:type I restriction-modification system DNA methylase subunit
MSATNRGSVRSPNDYYRTPPYCTRAILPYIVVRYGSTVLDPCCGDGAVLDAVKAYHPGITTCGIEIDAERAATARHDVVVGDALDMRWPESSVIITNPPYSLAMQFVQRALREVQQWGTVAMLLRLNWLASQKRAAWLRNNTPSVYVLPKRPSFTGGGNDACDYAWFLWSNDRPTVRILEV